MGPRGGLDAVVKVKGKAKVVPVLFLTKHHAMKAYWRVKV
jgi:hypothetical protein